MDIYTYIISEYEDIIESPCGYEKLDKNTMEPPPLPRRNEVDSDSKEGGKGTTETPLSGAFCGGESNISDKNGPPFNKVVGHMKLVGPNNQASPGKNYDGGDDDMMNPGDDIGGYEIPEPVEASGSNPVSTTTWWLYENPNKPGTGSTRYKYLKQLDIYWLMEELQPVKLVRRTYCESWTVWCLNTPGCGVWMFCIEL